MKDTAKEANKNLSKMIMVHLNLLQGGKFGIPTLEDLEICGKAHVLIEEIERY